MRGEMAQAVAGPLWRGRQASDNLETSFRSCTCAARCKNDAMGQILWLLAGVVMGVLVMLPITRRWLRLAEKRAREAERRAKDAERLAELGSMTGGLAHEIKNPLSTIGLNAQLLSEGIGESDLPAEQRERLVRRIDALSREAERLRGILTDFLQFAGRIKLDPQPRDIGKLVDELADFFHPQCLQAGVMLRTHLPPASQPVIARVDEGLLKQAILNLMLNAVQAMSEPDSAVMRAASKGGGEAGGRPGRGELILRVDADGDEVHIHVIDTGPGIDEAKLGDIFRPYVSLRSGGTGLGLPTARRIVQEHGGRMTVHSEVGRGSDFTIHLPQSAANATAT
jgi:signal transduction histidine kinase